jgi:hypothetical protein
MTNFLHWRKLSCALVLWSGYVVAWTVITGSGPVLFTLWWLTGTIACCSLWVATQPDSAGARLRQALRPAGLDELAPGPPPAIPPVQ